MSPTNSNYAYFDVTEAWQFEQMAMNDLTDVIYDMDENKVRLLLFQIAKAAQTDSSEFAQQIWKRILPLIEEWAEEQAELAREWEDCHER